MRCNCFGGGDRAGVVGVQSLVRNAVLVGCALAAAGTERLRLEVPPLPAALTILSTVATAEVVRQLLRIRAATGRLLPSMERSR